MRKIVLPLVAGFTCLVSATTFRSINATTRSSPDSRSFVQGESLSKTPRQSRTLTVAERVVYQQIIEDVYWRHRIWPKDNHDSKPALEAVISHAELEKKVRDYLHDSQALEDYWQRSITA